MIKLISAYSHTQSEKQQNLKLFVKMVWKVIIFEKKKKNLKLVEYYWTRYLDSANIMI